MEVYDQLIPLQILLSKQIYDQGFSGLSSELYSETWPVLAGPIVSLSRSVETLASLQPA